MTMAAHLAREIDYFQKGRESFEKIVEWPGCSSQVARVRVRDSARIVLLRA
jgi:hypothetical protein